MTALIQIALGGVLLLAGRRLYWLLAAAAGFVLGLFVTQTVLPDQSQAVMLIVPLVIAAIFAVLAVVGQRFIIGLVGFVAGGIALSRLLMAFSMAPAEPSTLLSLAVFILGGVIGAFLLSRLFELGLIVLSSVLGAEILLGGVRQLVDLPEGLGAIPLLVLAALGLIAQLGLLRK